MAFQRSLPLTILAICIASVWAIALENTARPSVSTTSGTLQGVYSNVNGRLFSKFLGVPYAQPPVGALRFRPSMPIQSSNKAIDASQFRESCMQPPHLRKLIYRPLHQNLNDTFVSEDCLYLNIYVPENVEATHNLAVMVWLPGEGFDFGNANQYDGSYLATHGNVIVVTVNYRVSVFGFLSTGDGQAPGNVGIRDQVLALHWIQNNIALFGGNPQQVTVFGRLTGSMSISALMSSSEMQQPRGNLLFNRAILQSGVAHGQWVFEKNPLQQAKLFARNVNCSHAATDAATTSDLLTCLQQVPASTLLKAAFTVPMPWRLTVDKDFLLEAPLRARLPEIDVMLGTTQQEGSICYMKHMVTNTEYLEKFLDGTLSSTDLGHLIDEHVDEFHGDVTHDKQVTDEIKERYSCNANAKDCLSRFLSFCGDMFSDAAINQLANRMVAEEGKVFRYQFSHRPSFSFYPQFINAAQGDEVLFVFGLVESPTLEGATKAEVKLSRQIMSAWSNFAKSGNPNPIQKDFSWPSYNPKKEYLEISTKMGPQSIKVTSTENEDLWSRFYNSQ